MDEARNIATVEASSQKLVEALRSGDFAAVGAMYTNDAILLAPGANIIMGKGNIQSFWEQRGGQLREARFATVNVKMIGEGGAVEIGTLRMRIDAAATPLAEEGGPQARGLSAKYVFVWQKVNDDWKICTSAWNRIGAGPGGRLTRG
jgi:ketosteroid isomerase-like protein